MFRFGLVIVLGCLALENMAFAEGTESADPFVNIELRNLGPSVAGGRVATVTGVSGKAGIYYVGTAGGGVWHTADGGMTWNNVFNKAASIGAVALAPSNPSDIWVGTGEANPRNDTLAGHGVYYSPDAGRTWKFKGLADAGQISRVIVSPTDPRTVYVAVLGNVWKPNKTRGIYMSIDGGDTWKQVLYVNDTTGASDIEIDPKNPNVMFAGMWTVQRKPWDLVNGSKDGGIWRSLDGGRSWKRLTAGLPDDPTDRVDIAIAPTDPNKIYALMATKDQVLWGSDDMGDHWHAISDDRALDTRPFYFSRLVVAPDNAQKVYFVSGQLLVSVDGGKSTHAIDRGVHVDHHDVWIDPENPDRIIQGNDGGAYETLNDGKSWRYFDNLPIGQLYTVSIGDTQPFMICGGLQDNNATCGPSNSLSPHGIWGAFWWGASTGDGQYVVPAPSDPAIVYSESQNAAFSRIDTRTMTATPIELQPFMPSVMDMPISQLKYRFNWTSPITVSPTDANTVYIGGNVVFKSTDGGNNWRPISDDLTRNDKAHQPVAGGPVRHDATGAENFDTILSMTIAPTDPKVTWVGTDDGLVWVTRDDGEHWKKVTPEIPAVAQLGRIYQIGVSPFDAGTAYLAVDAHVYGDEHPYVYKTSTYGSSWQRIDAGLPDDAAALVVREDPNQRGLLALGTNHGLYISHDSGARWMRITANLPATMAVWDLKFTKDPHDLVLATHGRGFWVFDNIEPLEEWKDHLADESFHLFGASTGIEWEAFNDRFIGSHLGPSPTDFVAPDPPSGPVIGYYLKSTHDQGEQGNKSSVTIKVSDSAGNPVATFHGPGKGGINRIAWNMRYDGAAVPWFMKGGFFGRAEGPNGPIALPGTYKVVVTAGEQTSEQNVRVIADPRLNRSLAVHEQALNAGLELRSQVDAMVRMLERTHRMSGVLDDVIDATTDAQKGSSQQAGRAAAESMKKQLDAFVLQMHNPEKQTWGQMFGFATNFYRLYGTISQLGPAQAPNAEQQQFIKQMQAEFGRYLAQFNGQLHKAVIEYNDKAFKAGVQTLPSPETVSVRPVKLPSAAARDISG